MTTAESTVAATEVMPDVVPSVSFDIRLKDKVEYIDFDYVQYDQRLQQAEVPVDASKIAKTSIVFAAGHALLDCGYYDAGNDVIRVNVGSRTPREAKTNNSLTHETQHWLDDVAGKWTERERRITTAANRLRMASFAGIYGNAPVALANLVFENSLVSTAGMSVAGLSMGVFGVSMGLYYGVSSWERSARQVARKNPGTVVSIIPQK